MAAWLVFAVAAAALVMAAAPLRDRRDPEKAWDVILGASRLLLVLHVGFFAVFGAGEVLVSPGGFVAVTTLAGVILFGLGLVVLAVRKPAIATGLLVALVAVVGVLFALPELNDLWDRTGPWPLALAVLILLGAWALSRQRIASAGWLSLAVAGLLLGRFLGMMNGPWWVAVNGLVLLTGAPVLAAAGLLLVARHRGSQAANRRAGVQRAA